MCSGENRNAAASSPMPFTMEGCEAGYRRAMRLMKPIHQGLIGSYEVQDS